MGNIGIYWDVLGYSGIYWDVLGCFGIYWVIWVILGNIGIYWDILEELRDLENFVTSQLTPAWRLGGVKQRDRSGEPK